jgi:hypothetical protein
MKPNEDVTKHLDMAQKYDVSYQKELLPIHAVQIHKNNLGSADLQVIVTGSNNKDYAVKMTSDGNGYVPAAELFCYELARLIDVPTPNYDIIIMRDSSLAFGSAWEGGVHHLKDINQIIAVLTGDIAVRDLEQFLSRVYAFDLFINNLDRHFGNYLFRQSYNSLIGLAFDYSRAWYEVGAYSYKSLEDKTSRTQQCHAFIKENGKYDRNAAKQTLNRIANLTEKDAEKLLQTIPDMWLSSDVKSEIVGWWASHLMGERITKLMGSI